MRALAHLLRGIVLLLGFALVSCIDGQEEYWLHADRSGRAEATYSFPASAARWHGGAAGIERTLAAFLAETPAITHSSHRVSVAGDRITVHIAATFASVSALREIGDGGTSDALPAPVRALLGDISVTREGRSLRVLREINAQRALPGAGLLPASRLAGRRLRYIVHLPEPAGKSNATRSADGGRTLVWDFPLTRAVRGPLTAEFTAPVPISAGLWWAAAGGGLAVAAALAIAIRKVRRTGQPAPAEL